MRVLGDVGFRDVSVVARFDSFRGTSKERTAVKYQVRGANVVARK